MPVAVLDERVGSTSLRAWLGIGGVLLTGGLVAVGAAHTVSLLPESIRPVSGSLAGAFGGIDLNLHIAGAIAVLVVMFSSYALAVSASARVSPRVLIAAILVLNALMLLGPPLVSTDIFSYQAYARMGAHYGINPYLHGPYAIYYDHIFTYVGRKWYKLPSAYGPLFTAGSYLLAPLTITRSVIAYKSIAAVASLGLVAIVWRSARLRGLDPVRAAALVGLNPLLVVYGVGGGHNDLLMLLALAAAIHALLARRERSGGALTMLAVGIKLTGGIVLPFALADGGRRRGIRGRRELVIGAVAGLTAIAGLSVALFGDGSLHLFSTVRQAQSEGDWLSIPGAVDARLGLVTVSEIVSGVLITGFVLACARLLIAVWRGTLDWIDAAGWATLAMLVAASSLLPWYVAWLLPLAALARDRRLRAMAVVMTGVVQFIELLGYIPHG